RRNAKIVSALKTLGKKADTVTIATDYDREGELIGVEALNIVKGSNPKITADRARYSAITPAEIKNTFKNLTEIDFNLAAAGESRQIIDLVWGAALTRYLSVTSKRLGKRFLSVGRVQSPTLALIVDREKEREAFVPEPYWELYAVHKEGFTSKHRKDRFWEKEEFDQVLSKVKDAKEGTVSDVKKGKRTEKPPTPFNTTEFIRAASRIGLSPANAMRIAENLYTNGFISYPRTDNTVYPASLDLKELVSMFLKSEFGEYASKLLKKPLKPTSGKKESTDHPPIHPASLASRKQLKDDEWKIYELVVRRFFATFADATLWKTLRVIIDIKGEDFVANGAVLVEPGWRYYYPYHESEDRILPDLKAGQVLGIEKFETESKTTKPPGRYGQARLIKVMEDLGLGTKSTRHEIIQKLYDRAYVHGTPIQPTKTAYSVVDTLEKYAKMVVVPDMTSKLEGDMSDIADGKITEDTVITESKEMLDSIFADLVTNKEKIAEGLRDGLYTDTVVGPCPECGADMVVRPSRFGMFIGCTGYPDCKFALSIPSSKYGMVIVTDKVCEEHNLHLLMIAIAGKRPIDVGCPYCNHLKWEAAEKAGNDPVIGPCPECGSDLVAKMSRSGGRFIKCTSSDESCKFTLPLPPPRYGELVITETTCEMHKGLHHVRIVREGARPWEIGCPYCSFIELQKNKENSKGKGGKTSRKTGAKSKSKSKKATAGNRKKDGLTDVAGIGDAIAKQLQSAGIKTQADLAAADAEELSGKLAKVSKKRIMGWQSMVQPQTSA
ncbi:MAG: DNA topoisomerase I, partial [ANME-2 cluster archaeon]